MRRRLKKFLPVFLVALLVQIFAPIGACWAASLAASDPLAAATICHGSGTAGAGQDDQSGHRAHDGCCSACSVLQTGVPVDSPQTSTSSAVDRSTSPVVWHNFAPDLDRSHACSHARARAPPFIS
ncbi:DUF2946 family protein [Bradyrhizobium lablabi]|uniref:DUF2946 family protein n=1 Tax=Bradyrhizobium lablabi TaxID=722472 RepID=UPI001BAB247C|nr:DUF2946 family protein [Bradyrhizobium lablabi]MBR0697526.1 DUF2946 domain-containing protein [Bradyrhizobium lablabi]